MVSQFTRHIPKPTSDQAVNATSRDSTATKPESSVRNHRRQPIGRSTAPLGSTASLGKVRLTNGSPLSTQVRDLMEPRFGENFENVRLHYDTDASTLAQSVAAQAFTVGNNVVFDQQHFSPETQRGRHLLAHELAHVVSTTSSTHNVQCGTVYTTTSFAPKKLRRRPLRSDRR